MFKEMRFSVRDDSELSSEEDVKDLFSASSSPSLLRHGRSGKGVPPTQLDMRSYVIERVLRFA